MFPAGGIQSHMCPMAYLSWHHRVGMSCHSSTITSCLNALGWDRARHVIQRKPESRSLATTQGTAQQGFTQRVA